MVTGKAPAFQFFAKDHIATLALLSLEEAGVWVKLCAHLWEHGGPMPVSLAHRIVPEKAMLSVCFLFAFSDESKSSETESSERTMWLPWMEKIRAEMDEKRALRVAAGKLGGRGNVRGSKAESKRKANAKQNESKRKHSRAAEEVAVEDRSMNTEVEEKKTRKPQTESDPAFEALWQKFDRYGSKAKSFAYWLKLSEVDRSAIVAAATHYVASTPGCRYRKQLEGWINPTNRLWERPIPVDNTMQTVAQKSQATIMSRTERPVPIREYLRSKSQTPTPTDAN